MRKQTKIKLELLTNSSNFIKAVPTSTNREIHNTYLQIQNNNQYLKFSVFSSSNSYRVKSSRKFSKEYSLRYNAVEKSIKHPLNVEYTE